jgi:hypothetical protein
MPLKTNKETFTFWLLNKKAKEIKSDTNIYVLINIKKAGEDIDFLLCQVK